jgi:hypothetical protein
VPARSVPAVLVPAALAALALVAALVAPAWSQEPMHGRLLEADPFTGASGALEEGEVELAVVSTRAATVTGGDAVFEILGLDAADQIVVTRNGEDVTDAFSPSGPGVVSGLVTGLVDGDNEVAVRAEHPGHGTRVATLPVRNHPITGPVFSGPHQEPFICRTVAMGLGEPLDDDCSIETRVQWYYLSTAGGTFRELEDPYTGYPADTMTTVTTDGQVVPYVVRLETSTINRGVTRIAVLDDPATRGPDAPYEPAEAWNGKMLHQWGASCGVGYHQGTNSVDSVLTGLVDGTGSTPEGAPAVPLPPVGDGYLVSHSTMTTLGVHCNQVLSAETFMMIREHVHETYGPVELAFGSGASGGAIQQVTTMDSYPGLLDGGVPMITFPDVVTTAMSPADCRLLLDVFEADGSTWTERKRTAVSGHLTGQICRDWDDMFADHLVATTGCHGAVPRELIYHPETNPEGVRCTLQDSMVNVMGVDPATGFANRPVDNVGVQYGREAFEAGHITAEEFVRLNEQIGGFDADGNIVDERMAMSPDLARKMYEIGAVSGRGALDQAPLIFTSTYVDPIPILGFHDAARAYQLRARLAAHKGRIDTHAIWSGLPLPNDAWNAMDRWITDLAAVRDAVGGTDAAGWADEVAATRPVDAADGCVVTTAGVSPLALNVPLGGDPGQPCEQAFRPLGSPRTAAGGPPSEDVIKCSLRPLDRDVDGDGLDEEQWARMETTFPDGVCDWSRPGVGEVQRSRTWLSFGTDTALATPQPITHVVARSVVVQEGGEPDEGRPGRHEGPTPPNRPVTPGGPDGPAAVAGHGAPGPDASDREAADREASDRASDRGATGEIRTRAAGAGAAALPVSGGVLGVVAASAVAVAAGLRRSR